MSWHIGELLVQKKLITWEQLGEALAEQSTTKEFTGEILIRKGYISRHLLFKVLADQHDIRFIDIKRIIINPKALEKVPRSVAEKYSIMPIELRDNILTVAICDPLKVWPEEELKQLTGVSDIRIVLCLPNHIQEAIEENYGVKKEA